MKKILPDRELNLGPSAPQPSTLFTELKPHNYSGNVHAMGQRFNIEESTYTLYTQTQGITKDKLSSRQDLNRGEARVSTLKAKAGRRV